MKALAAGKHVLLEKPAANNAEETKAMFELAERKSLVLLEAFHYRYSRLLSTTPLRTSDIVSRFHPAIQRVKAIIDSGELGAIKSITANLSVPRSSRFSESDIRFDYGLGGGALMDMGCMHIFCIGFRHLY